MKNKMAATKIAQVVYDRVIEFQKNLESYRDILDIETIIALKCTGIGGIAGFLIAIGANHLDSLRDNKK